VKAYIDYVIDPSARPARSVSETIGEASGSRKTDLPGPDRKTRPTTGNDLFELDHQLKSD